MQTEPINEKKVQSFIYNQIDIDCESALPGGKIYGKAITNIKLSPKNQAMKIKIDEVSAYVIIRSENSKVPQLTKNMEFVLFQEKQEKYTEGKKDFKISTVIPKDAMTSLEIEGFDYGECKNILYVKLITKGTFLVPKKPSDIPKQTPPTTAQVAPQGSTTQTPASQSVTPPAPVLSESDLFDTHQFVLVSTDEIEVDNDTPGEKVQLQKPVIRQFTTQTGMCCCKNDTKVDMLGLVYNPNLKSYGDEIKFYLKLDTNGKNDNLKSIAVITSFGCLPVDDPRPDLMVWNALSIYRFFPDSSIKNGDYDVTGNASFLNIDEQNQPLNKEGEFLTFVSNTEKVPNIPTHFKYPEPQNQREPTVIYGKVKIGRRNGLGTFYSNNGVFKTVYALKIIPELLGSESNGEKANKGTTGIHLTIPMSVKADNPPSQADLRALQMMYEGGDQEQTISKQKLGKPSNVVTPMMPAQGDKNVSNLSNAGPPNPSLNPNYDYQNIKKIDTSNKIEQSGEVKI